MYVCVHMCVYIYIYIYTHICNSMNQSFFPDVHWYNFLKKKLGVDSTNVSWERKSNATSNCTRHGGQHIANMFLNI